MSHRPLALVSGLTLGDYLLWNWSLERNHEVVALVSGLTLPPLAVASVWLLALNLALLIARSGRRWRMAGRRLGRADRGSPAFRADVPVGAATPTDQEPASAAGASAPSSGKLAA